MNGVPERRDEQWYSRAWMECAAELEAVFGPVGASSGWAAELAAVDLGGPSRSMSREELTAVWAGQREARAAVNELRKLLVASGLEVSAFPALCGKVDRRNRPVVVLGVVDAATVRRICALLRAGLRGRSIPPATGETWPA